ncbi:pancreatic secretory granule membrane major glycoprotein GP2-like [Clavelina lepadiformis]|uniref:pancreatic secretory granule membrane major glycoprotein GP2-like n=1 Tax=Clavelina lepadiformis TaxID=159417 RepID=UPI0040429888
MKTTLICVILSGCLLLVTASPCEPNPCENEGECFEESSNGKFTCLCTENYAGLRCDLPFPGITCGNKSIEITIDKRMVTELGLDDDTGLVYFEGWSGCIAVDRNGQYHLQVDAPFTDCGIKMRRDETHGYLFKQNIVWNKRDENIERKHILVDFQCNYTDRYEIMAGPIIPTVTTIDFETSYGTFTVQMDLFRDQSFSSQSKYGFQPVIAIEDEVCVQQSLVNVNPEHLVLTLLNCWASTKQDGTGLTHSLVSNKCSNEETTEVVQNGEGSEAQFCFQMFKWQENFNAVYVHCLVNVCNATAFPEFCTCQNERVKREVFSMTVEKQKSESRVVSSELIRVVNGNYLDDWLLFLEENPSEDTIQESTADGIQDFDPNIQDDQKENKGPDSTVLIAVGVVLVIAVIILGVVIGVYINFSRVRAVTKGVNVSRLT